MLYGRTLRDCLLTIEEAHNVRSEWRALAEDREWALAKRHLRNIDAYNAHAAKLPPLTIGDTVFLQN